MSKHPAKKVVGEQGCHGAVFVYKSDTTAPGAWSAVERLAAAHTLRGELHDSRKSMLRAVRQWARKVDPDGAMLMIYAHMGARGMVPETGLSQERIYWAELATALGDGVHTLWLVGCKSELSTKVWSPLRSPVRGYLLAAKESAPFSPILPLFSDEVSIKRIVPFDEMIARIRVRQPNLGQYLNYYYPTKTGWIEGVRDSSVAQVTPITAEQLNQKLRELADLVANGKSPDEVRAAMHDLEETLELRREQAFIDEFYGALAAGSPDPTPPLVRGGDLSMVGSPERLQKIKALKLE